MEVSGKRALNLQETCEICQMASADGFCNDCKEFMCQKCFQQHTIAKPCRHHVLSSLAQSAGHVSRKIHEEKCGIHPIENIKYYCRKHEIVGCGDCMIASHGVCKPELIKDLAKNFQDTTEFKDILRKLQKYDTENAENTNLVERNLKENKAFLDKALGEIRKFRKDINDYIDLAEKTMIAEAKKHFMDNETLLSQLQQKIATVGKDIEEIREKLDTNLHKENDLFIRMTECKPRVSYVARAVGEIKESSDIKIYSFKPEQKLKDLLTSDVKLGTIQLCVSKKQKQTICEKTEDKLNEDTQPSASRTMLDGKETLAFLRHQPQFKHMKTLVQQNPALLPELLQQIGRSNPTLLQMLHQNSEQFVEMLNDTEDETEEESDGCVGGQIDNLVKKWHI